MDARITIAAQLMQGFLISPDYRCLNGATVDECAKVLGIEVEQFNQTRHIPLLMARDAVVMTDALLAELAKTPSS